MESQRAGDGIHIQTGFENRSRHPFALPFVIRWGNLNQPKKNPVKLRNCSFMHQQDRQEMKRRMKSKVEMIRKQEESLSSREVLTIAEEKFTEKENECFG
jgi:hypothetical protein